MSTLSPLPEPRYDLCGKAHDYPDWVGAPFRSILICSNPRSGSTMLGEALYFAGGLGCPLEYFHDGFRPGFEHRWAVTSLSELNLAVRRYRTDPSGVLSVKLFWRDVVDLVEALAPSDFPAFRATPADQVSPETYRRLATLLNELFPVPDYIHLVRRDRLRQAVSTLTAIQTNTWRRIPTVEGEAPTASVAYDFDRIGQLIASSLFCHAHWTAFFHANGIMPQMLTYEELVADYTATVERLLQALGNPGKAPPIRMERQSTATNEALMLRYLRDQRAAQRT